MIRMLRNTFTLLVLLVVCIGGYFMMYQQHHKLAADLSNQTANAVGSSEVGTNTISAPIITKPIVIKSVPTYQAGINLLIYGHPSNLRYKSEKLFAHLRSLGINSVSVTFPIFEASATADTITADKADTPTDGELTTLIQAAQENGLVVMLRPLLDEKSIVTSGHWRGTIIPNHVHKWFDSYSKLVVHYAKLAQLDHVQIIDIGTEYSSLNSYTSDWDKVITDTQKVYRGSITYSFNWTTAPKITQFPWARKLSFVGVDAWYPIALRNGATVAQLEKATKPYLDKLKPILSQYKVVFSEAGMLPVAGGYRSPYVWSAPGQKINYQAQENYYTSVFKVWHNKITGVYWWNATLGITPTSNSPQFSPIGTPTESVLKEYFKRYTQSATKSPSATQ